MSFSLNQQVSYQSLSNDMMDNVNPDNNYLNRPIPAYMNAIVIRREDEKTLQKILEVNKRMDAAIHFQEVPVPEPSFGEVLIAVMAASLNYNTLWSLRHEPVSPFRYLGQFAQLEPGNERHNLDYQIIGSDACGIVVKTGPGVTSCRLGDRVVIHPAVVNPQSPMVHKDAVIADSTRAWGFETNFGALADYCLVRASQLLPKPAHLSWEEAASMPLINSTVYRMLISPNGANMRLGDSVLIWGGAGGLGSLAIQYVLRGGGHPIAIVSNEGKEALVRELGCHAVINRAKECYDFFKEDGRLDMRNMLRFRKHVRKLNDGRDPDIVFEHTGFSTFSTSVFVAAKGGRIVTCGSTTGYEHFFDNRYLWMYAKKIIGSHGSNWNEAWEANDLVCRGYITPTLSQIYTLENTLEGVKYMRSNSHVGKIGILCQAPKTGLGIKNNRLRKEIGEKRIHLFRKGDI